MTIEPKETDRESERETNTRTHYPQNKTITRWINTSHSQNSNVETVKKHIVSVENVTTNNRMETKRNVLFLMGYKTSLLICWNNTWDICWKPWTKCPYALFYYSPVRLTLEILAHFFIFCHFSRLSSDWCVVWSRFFYWRKQRGWADLSNTLNMFVKSTENFLEAFEKKVSAQKMSKNEAQNGVGIFWHRFFFF